MKMWREIVPIMMNPTYANELKMLKAHRKSGYDLNNEDIKLELKLLPVYQEVDSIVKFYQKRAETELQLGGQIILDQEYADDYMRQGDIKGAAEIQKRNLKTQKLLKYNNN